VQRFQSWLERAGTLESKWFFAVYWQKDFQKFDYARKF